jgi:hypothetical protein
LLQKGPEEWNVDKHLTADHRPLTITLTANPSPFSGEGELGGQ